MKKTGLAYIHADKLSMREIGEELGMTGEPLSMFRHALAEVEIFFEVDMETGLIEIIKVDGHRLEKE